MPTLYARIRADPGSLKKGGGGGGGGSKQWKECHSSTLLDKINILKVQVLSMIVLNKTLTSKKKVTNLLYAYQKNVQQRNPSRSDSFLKSEGIKNTFQ